MKRFFTFLLTVFVAANVVAQEYAEVDGINYGYGEDTAFVAYPLNGYYTGDIVIPSQISIFGKEYTVTTISKESFIYSSITSITIPKTVKKIEDNAFGGTGKKLSSIIVDSDNTKYDSRNNCNAIIETSTNKLITGCMNTTIPNDIVTLGKGSFSECSEMESIIIPNSVTSIEDSVFLYCTKLNTITIPETVTSIGKYAFYCCESLTSIKIPDNITKIEDYIFYRCLGLTSISIPENVLEIGSYAFDLCQISSVIIPESVTIIGQGAFSRCSMLSSVTIPESVDSIGSFAFRDCSSLTSINIPNRITKLENYTFSGCSSLSTIKIPESVTFIGKNAFSKCTSLTSINIPSGVTKIESATFSYCENLTSIKIPEGVTAINDNAFLFCKALSSINIPEGITKISHSTFYGCSNLETITIPNSVTIIDFDAFVGCKKLSSINIPDGVTTIGSRAFESCTGIKSIIIPETVDSIGYGAFMGCTNLISIILPNKLTSLEQATFYNCSNLISITIPHSVRSIGDRAFMGCANLRDIRLSNNLTEIDTSLFDGCTSLTSVIIPNSVTSINRLSFNGCISLSSISVPNNLVSIEDYAFLNCNALTSIKLPESLTSIGYRPFDNSENPFNLSCVSCSAETPPTTNGDIYRVGTYEDFENYDNATLIVPCESIEAYKNHEIWGKFKNIECRSLSLKTDFPNVTITDGDELPSINLLDYFAKGDNEEISFIVESSDNQVVYPAVLGDKLEFVQYGTGTTTITVTATVEPISMSRAFTFTINSKPNQPEKTCNLSISSEITNATCNSVANGKIEISVSGGTEPYQYKWTTGRTSSGIYNVGAGSYSVLVIDSLGCTTTETFSISEPSAVTIFEEFANPTCGNSNGRIDLTVVGGIEPYSYVWEGLSQATNTLENLSAGNYTITVTDGNSCTAVKSISLSDQSAPTILDPIVTRSKCKDPQGSIQISVSGGAGILKYDWSDSTDVADNLNRPKMYPGIYSLTVTDENNCQATKFVIVPHIPLKQPEIALVSYDDSVKQNIVVWRKELTDDIDHYNIYREINQSGEYEKIGTSAYNDESIYVDKTADFNAFSKRYRISAENNCWESPLSRECKTMLLQWKKKANGSVSLWWDAYEGSEYVKYSIYRLTPKGVEVFAKIPANKISYVIDALPEETIGFYVAIELVHPVYVNEFLKAENGPFIIAISNIAELENRDAVDDITENQVLAFGGDKSIFVNNANGEDVIVCDLTGKTIARKQNVDSTTIPVQTAGVYIVIVGDRAFKVVVQ